MLKLQNITKTFNPGTVNEKVALSGIDLHLKPGDFATIIGSNGAGKSTMFNAICGDFMTDTGSITLAGEDVTFLPVHERARKIGRLFQDPMRGSAPGMTIEENLSLAAGHGGWFSSISKADRNRFREQLSLLSMGLEDRMKQPVGLLSGGQRQALTLMMATLDVPRLLLLDEHTAALDPKTAAKVLELSDKIIEENHLTALMVTHNMKDAITHGNRLIMMCDGKVILNIEGEEKKKLTVEHLLQKFEEVSGSKIENDRMLLSE